MKDFAKSIVCNTKAEVAKVGNAKDKNGKELRIGDIVLVWTSAGERAGKVKAISGDRITVAIRNEGDWSTPGKLADKVSNSKVGNAEIVKDGNTWVVLYAEGTKSKEFNSEAEAKKFAAQVGNSKVGNADIFSGNYIILADNGEVWFRDEHENVHIRNIDSWAQKRIASYQRSIDEIKKGVNEAKQAAKKAGMI